MNAATVHKESFDDFANNVLDGMHHAVARLTGPARVEKTRHLSQGYQVAGQRDGGFSGNLLERRHRAEPRPHLLHSFC